MSTRKRKPAEKPPAARMILMDELEYTALRRFWELDKLIESPYTVQQYSTDMRLRLIRKRTELRGVIDLLMLRPLPRPEDRGVLNGIRVRF